MIHESHFPIRQEADTLETVRNLRIGNFRAGRHHRRVRERAKIKGVISSKRIESIGLVSIRDDAFGCLINARCIGVDEIEPDPPVVEFRPVFFVKARQSVQGASIIAANEAELAYHECKY